LRERGVTYSMPLWAPPSTTTTTTAADTKSHAAATPEQLAAAQAQLVQPLNVRELLSAIKVAVLAPCIKLHVNDSEPRHVGSPAQIDYEQLGSMLEAAVLNRFSQVRLLDTDTPLAHDGAHAIFPELKETMAHVQKEVRERLAAMMASAGD